MVPTARVNLNLYQRQDYQKLFKRVYYLSTYDGKTEKVVCYLKERYNNDKEKYCW